MNRNFRDFVLTAAVIAYVSVARQLAAQDSASHADLATVARRSVGQDAASLASHKNCYRGRSKPACDRFLLTEFNYFRSVLQPHGEYSVDGESASRRYVYQIHPQAWKFSWEIGGMANRGAHSAIGATLLIDANNVGGSIGAKARYRRWLSPEGVAIDVGAGVRTARDDATSDYSGNAPVVYRGSRNSVGFVGDVSINASDYAAIVARVDVNRYDERWQPTISLGVRAGSKPALFATAGTLATYGLLMVAIIGTLK